jgi:cytoskeletal protein CcmA (bactofilin family)
MLTALSALLVPTALASADPFVDHTPLPPIIRAADDTVVIDTHARDVMAMGQSVELRANVDHNAFVMAQNILISDGLIDGDAFLMGQTIDIQHDVHGDVFLLGERITIAPGVEIHGDVHALGETVNIAGMVHGGMEIGAARTVLDVAVAGDVEIETARLVVEDGTFIKGDLHYESTAEGTFGTDVTVLGDLEHTVPDPHEEAADEAPPSLLSRVVSTTLWSGWHWLSSLVVGGILFWLGGPTFRSAARKIHGDQALKSMAVGFALLVLLPAVSALAIATLVGIPAGLIGLSTWALALYAGRLLAAVALGDVLLRAAAPEKLFAPLLSLGLGLAVLMLATSVPYLGGFLWMLATFAGVGALATAVHEARQ